MTEEKTPRVRGLKERQEAYREGFLAGVQHALTEAAELKRIESDREQAMKVGLAKLAHTTSVRPRRRKRGGDDDGAHAVVTDARSNA